MTGVGKRPPCCCGGVGPEFGANEGGGGRVGVKTKPPPGATKPRTGVEGERATEEAADDIVEGCCGISGEEGCCLDGESGEVKSGENPPLELLLEEEEGGLCPEDII